MSTVRRFTLAASILASALALTACASTGTTATTAGTPPPLFASSAAPAVATSAAPAPTPSPSASVMCTTHACIVTDVQRSLVGQVADDYAVINKADCFKSTVRHNPGNTWTVSCDLSYSDGSVWAVLATLLVAKDQIAWEPTGQLQ